MYSHSISIATIEPQGAHLPAQCLLAHRDTKLFPEPLGQITQTPPHDTIEIGRRHLFSGLCQCGPLTIVEPLFGSMST